MSILYKASRCGSYAKRRSFWSSLVAAKLFVAILVPPCIAAQIPQASAKAREDLARQQQARTEATSAFKAGNPAAALARLESAVKQGKKARHPDLQVAEQLNLIACGFSNAGDGARAREVAGLTLSKLALPESRFARAESVNALVLTGEINEHVLGDFNSAKLAYQRALILNPNLPHAAQRLAHLEATERHAGMKSTANALLRERAAEAARVMRTRK